MPSTSPYNPHPVVIGHPGAPVTAENWNQFAMALCCALEQGAAHLTFSPDTVHGLSRSVHVCTSSSTVVELLVGALARKLDQVSSVTFCKIEGMRRFPKWMDGLGVKRVEVIGCPDLVETWPLGALMAEQLESLVVRDCFRFGHIPTWLGACGGTKPCFEVLEVGPTERRVDWRWLWGCTALKHVVVEPGSGMGLCTRYNIGDMNSRQLACWMREHHPVIDPQ